MTTSSDTYKARREARRLAGSIGLDKTATEEAALIAAELATNLQRYAIGGLLTISIVEVDGGKALQIESRDDGPGIDDLSRALQDGFSTVRSMGSGLPAVRRLANTFTIETGKGGTVVTARKWSRT